MELVVPPDLSGLQEPSGVLAQAEFNGVATPVQVWVVGPSALQDEPGGSESAREWLVRTGWLPQPGSGGVTTVSDESDGEIVLPAGLAYRAALTADAGTETASRVIVYEIRTSTGLAVMQIVGEPGTVQARIDELNLIALLVTFGE